jgi:hypothetical protein
MKTLLAIYLIFASVIVWAGEVSSFSAVKGKVLEIKEVESYTYLRLKTKDDEIWAAVLKAPVTLGTDVKIENVMIMNNFESKTLKRTFKTILFGTLEGASSSVNGMTEAHQRLANIAGTNDINIPKANGSNSWSVAEIMTKGTQLKDQTVLVRGKVVKFNPEIMGKNWVHLRDGSGSVKDNTNDVLVTTMNQAKIGDVVTAKGIVHTNKDFGAGYYYNVIIEEATLQP